MDKEMILGGIQLGALFFATFMLGMIWRQEKEIRALKKRYQDGAKSFTGTIKMTEKEWDQLHETVKEQVSKKDSTFSLNQPDGQSFLFIVKE